MPEVDLKIVADIRDLKKAWASVPGLVEKDAKKAMAQLDAVAKSATRSVSKQAQEATRLVKKENKEIAQAMKGLGDSISGGLLGQMDDLTKSFGSAGLGGALGAAAGSLAAVTAAGAAYTAGMAAVIGATVALTRAGAEAVERIDELDGALVISQEARDSVVSANASLDALAATVDPLTVMLANETAPAVTKVADVVGKLALMTADAWAGFGRLSDSVSGWGQALALVNPQLYETIRGISAADELTSGYDQRLQDIKDAIAANAEATKDETEATKRSSKTRAEAIEKVRDEYEARSKLGDLIRDAMADTLTAEDKVREAFRKRIEAVQEVYDASAKTSGDLAAYQEALAQAEARRDRDLTTTKRDELAKQVADYRKAIEEQLQADYAAQEARDELAKMEAEQAAESLQRIREETAEKVAAVAKYFDMVTDALSALGESWQKSLDMQTEAAQTAYDEVDAEVKRLQEKWKKRHKNMTEVQRKELRAQIEDAKESREAKGKELEKQEKKTKAVALALFYANKAAAVGQSIVNTALAVTASMAQVAPPLGIPIQVATAAAGALQTAAILAQPPPKFYVGRQPDEVSATLHKGEAVMNTRAVRNMGGPDAVAALNRGTSGGAQPQPLYIAFDGRIEAKLMLRALQDPGVVAAVRRAASGAAFTR